MGTTIITSFAYDNADRLTAMSHQIVGGSTLASYAFAYDDASRITSETDASGTASYTYDDFGQLTGVSGARSESYSYDANGNRTMSGYGSTTGNRLTAGAGHSYNYDDEGNMISKTETATGQVTSFTYDYRNRLTQVTRRGSGGTALAESSYTYDALDRRIRVTSDADGAGSNPAVTTWTVYDGVNPYADFNGSGQLSERYLYALAVDALLARTDASNDSDWYLTDRLGSVREVVDAATGSVEYSARYDSYGNVIAATGVADRFGYTAREWDGVARLQYNRARYYDPAVGRWISEDPIGYNSGSLNNYGYANNNAIDNTDPFGLYKVRFGYRSQAGRWTSAQMLSVTRALQTVEGRVNSLLKEIDEAIEIIAKEKPCVRQLLYRHIHEIQKVLSAMKDGFESDRNLWFYHFDFNRSIVRIGHAAGDDQAWAYPKLDEIDLNDQPGNNTLALSNDLLAEVIFHELSHFYGTVDGLDRGYWLDAPHLAGLTRGSKFLSNSGFKMMLVRARNAASVIPLGAKCSCKGSPDNGETLWARCQIYTFEASVIGILPSNPDDPSQPIPHPKSK